MFPLRNQQPKKNRLFSMERTMNTVQKSNKKSSQLKNNNTQKMYSSMCNTWRNLFTMIPLERSSSHSTRSHLRAKLKRRMSIGSHSTWSQALFNCVTRLSRPCKITFSYYLKRARLSLLFTRQGTAHSWSLRSLATTSTSSHTGVVNGSVHGQ